MVRVMAIITMTVVAVFQNDVGDGKYDGGNHGYIGDDGGGRCYDDESYVDRDGSCPRTYFHTDQHSFCKVVQVQWGRQHQ